MWQTFWDPSRLKFAGYVALAPPENTLKLAAIGIGRGQQFYTCANDSATPEHTGGQAQIYDANPLIQYLPGEEYLHNLVKEFYNYDYASLENSTLKLLGHHYYAPRPTFDLGETGFFQGSVIQAIQSPLAEAEPRAIDWAFLLNVTTNSTLHKVYRVKTYGGGGPKDCSNQPEVSTWQYATEYWFYQ